MSYEEVPKRQGSFMIAKLGTGSAYVAVLAAIFVAAAIPASHAQVLTPRPPTARQTITLRLGHLDVFTVERPFKTIVVGDPKVVDTQAVTDRSIIITPQSEGETTLLFLDEHNEPLNYLAITVDVAGPGRVKIHNKALLNSYTSYRCTSNGCQYVDETTVREPAPLPRGHSDQTSRDASPTPTTRRP
jgi:Flp pilus assembly secretin CpaC